MPFIFFIYKYHQSIQKSCYPYTSFMFFPFSVYRSLPLLFEFVFVETGSHCLLRFFVVVGFCLHLGGPKTCSIFKVYIECNLH